MATTVTSPEELLGMEGAQLGPTAWLRIDQQRIDMFAACTDDHQWIHVDPERSRSGPFGTTIAHGFLSLSMIGWFSAELLEMNGCAQQLNVGLNRVRFLAPVPAGHRIRASATIQSVERKNGGIQCVMTVTMELEGSEKPAFVADMITRYYADAG